MERGRRIDMDREEFVIKFITDDKVTTGDGRYVVITGFGKNHFLALDEHANEMKFSYGHNWKPYTEPAPEWDWNAQVIFGNPINSAFSCNTAFVKLARMVYATIARESCRLITKKEIESDYEPIYCPDNWEADGWKGE